MKILGSKNAFLVNSNWLVLMTRNTGFFVVVTVLVLNFN